MSLSKSELKAACKLLLDDFEGVLSWKWEGGAKTLTAQFSTEGQEQVGVILERHLRKKWDRTTISTAPAPIKDGDFGDLRSDQLLFTTDLEGNIRIIAAWWPWGDGQTITVRLTSSDNDSAAPVKTGFLTKLKNVFGL